MPLKSNSPYQFFFYIFVHKKITITIDTAILMKNNKKLCSYIRAIFYITGNCDYNFNPWSIFESMTSFTPILDQNSEQGKLTAAVNSWK